MSTSQVQTKGTLVDRLRRALPAGRLVVDPDVLSSYSRDQSHWTSAGMPAALVRAHEQADVVSVLRIAEELRIPVVTRGAGTGLAGAANAQDGCILLSLESMNQILEISVDDRVARVQAGVINGDLDAAVAAHGLAYLPDPGSKAISTIGGNISTNAGGMCCARYGVTREHVAALRVVLAGGRTIDLGSATRKNVAGLDLMSLLVGSEGTLGVVTEALVRLAPRTAHRSCVVGAFASSHEALISVAGLTRSMTPTSAEFMDRTTLEAVADMTAMDFDNAGAIVLVQFDGYGAHEAAAECAARLEAQARDVFRTDDPREVDEFMSARSAALPALERLGSTLLDDVCVPVSRLPELIAEVERISTSSGLTIATFGHAADGNMHPTVIFDSQDAALTRAAQGAFDDIVSAALKLGGTISGEHGIGTLKLDLLADQLHSEVRELMHSIKSAFDPYQVLNPGRGY